MQDLPSYPLEEVHRLVRAGALLITGSARRDSFALGCDEDDIIECVLALTLDEFYKTMPAKKATGLMQDVYHATYDGRELYVKIQIARSPNADTTVVISFKKL